MLRSYLSLWVFLFVIALSYSGGVQSATVYKCVDGEGRTVFSDQPCNGGDEVEIQPMPETQVGRPQKQSLEDSRRYNKEVAIRIEVRKLRREKSQLQEKRRSMIEKRDSEIARLSDILNAVSTKDLHARAYWINQLSAKRSFYNQLIVALEGKIFQKQAELQELNKKQEAAQSRPSARILDRASWGACSLYIEGEETALSLRVRAEGYEPGELAESISCSGDETVRKQVRISPEGCYDALVLPRVRGSSGGKASFTLNGRNCRLTVNYRWRMP
ncbi:MAG: DUF4124 domain-containing protein [Sedimenticolaceae bacterium]